MKPEITIDNRDGVNRAAVWLGKELLWLHFCRDDMPDLTGAVTKGRISRVIAGGKTAFVDCENGVNAHVRGLKGAVAGDKISLRITEAPRCGKAWGAIAADGEPIAPPPSPQQRAIADLKIDDIPFSAAADCAGRSARLDEIVSALLSPRVALGSGGEESGHIVIEQTEALVSIDVNAPESANPLSVNLSALREAAKQVLWRNLSGIVVVDLLKMKGRADNSKAMNALARAVEGDPANVRVGGVSRLGLLEFSRRRRGYSLQEIWPLPKTGG